MLLTPSQGESSTNVNWSFRLENVEKRCARTVVLTKIVKLKIESSRDKTVSEDGNV
jgi:hypothetical protein